MDSTAPVLPSGLLPTLETVARAAHVSESTVSRALRDNPKIAPATRQRIKALAEQLGYRPNPYLSVLMAHVRQTQPAPYSATLAWLDRSPKVHPWRDNHVQADFYSGAVKRAEALGFRLERIPCSEPKLSRTRLTEVLRARGIHGVLCTAEQADAKLLEFPIELSYFATATVGCRFVGPELHFSTNDQFFTAGLGYRQLLALGYKRIALLTTRRLEEIVDYRFAGGYLAAIAQQAETKESLIFYHDAKDPEALRAWLAHLRPDAVLVTGRMDACAAIRAAGQRVPEDIAVAVLDWHEGLPNVAGVRQNHARVGAGAIDLLVSQITRNEFGPPVHAQGVLVEGEWLDGASAPPR